MFEGFTIIGPKMASASSPVHGQTAQTDFFNVY